jgi:type IV secretory pathway VirB10-like protein
MKPILIKQTAVIAAALCALGMSTVASAQYIWLDSNGVRQYSDTPPPVSVPLNRILKQPGPGTTSKLPPVTETTDDNPAAAKADAPLTTAEKNAEEKKRKLEQAEKDAQTAAQAKQAADKLKNCESARENQRALDSGQRIAKFDKNGERYFMSDEQKAQEAQNTQKAISNNCK